VVLLGLLEKTGPVLFLQLLLPQNQLDPTVGVVHLAVLGVDLGIEGQRDLVCNALASLASEGDLGGGDVEVGIRLGDVGSLEVHIEVVALGFIGGRALSPGNWKTE
jgi:hypothetical protein